MSCTVSPLPEAPGHGWVIASSALFFIPTIISFFRQSIVVTLIYFFSALFSTLYHASNEGNYSQEDVMWAVLAIFISLIMLAILTLHYPIWNWRILIPICFGVAGIVIYLSEGQLNETACHHADEQYSIFHSIWHLLMALSATALVWSPIDLSEANMSYAQMYVEIRRSNQKNQVNFQSFKK